MLYICVCVSVCLCVCACACVCVCLCVYNLNKGSHRMNLLMDRSKKKFMFNYIAPKTAIKIDDAMQEVKTYNLNMQQKDVYWLVGWLIAWFVRTRDLKKAMDHEGDCDTNCNWYSLNDPQKLGKGVGRFGNPRTSRDYPNYSIVEISQSTYKSPGDFNSQRVLKQLQQHKIIS